MNVRVGHSLRRKLIIVMMATTFVGLVVALGAMIAYDLNAYHQGRIADMAAQAELLGRTTAPALTFDDARMAEENLHFLGLTRVSAAALYNAHGELFASFAADPQARDIPARPGSEGVHIKGRRLTVFKRIVDNGELLGTIYVRANYELYDRLMSYAGIAALVMAVSMLVAFMVSAWLQRIVARPILSVAEVAREVVDQGDYSRRVARPSDDEVGALVMSFNEMLQVIEHRTRELQASMQEKAREIEDRRHAQQEVMRLNAQLEERVSERTMQLEASNRELAEAKGAAESASRAKSEFLSRVSHELRTPLNAIIGFGQLLQSQSFPASEAQRREFVEHIVKAGHHLLELINEILNLAQIESGRLTLSMEPVAVQDVLDECRIMVESMAEQRGIRLVFPNAAGMRVMADRMRLKQVMINLLSNAIKYNREGGSVAVDALFVQGDKVRMAVQDTGLGMSPSQLEQLFQPFNRLGQEARGTEGTGIGLVVTRHLVEMMCGEIGVASTVGMGTVFWVELTAAAARSPGGQPAKADL